MSGSMQEEYDYDYARAVGERALAYLKEYALAPNPRCYALLYNHTAGYDQALSRAVLDAVHAHGRLTPADAAKLCDQFLSPNGSLAAAQDGLSGRVDAVSELVDRAQQAFGGLNVSLRDAAQGFVHCSNARAAQEIVDDVVGAGNRVIEETRHLQRKLKQSRHEIDELKRSLTRLRERSDIDPLTRLPGRRLFDMRLGHAIERARRYKVPLSLMIADLDDFARYNRAHGRDIGDRILKAVADLVSKAVGGRGAVARYSGDQFAAILVDTRLEAAIRLAESLRAQVLSKRFVRRSSGRSVGRVTLSIGVALFCPGDTPETLIDRTMDCLRTAKRLGRNRVRWAASTAIAQAD